MAKNDESASKKQPLTDQNLGVEPGKKAPVTEVDGSYAMDFSVYAHLKNIPQHHSAGMLAHTELRTATFADWETAFKDY